MKTSKNFYKRALTLFALLPLCVAVSCTKPEQPEKPLVIVNNNYVKCPDTKPSQVREEPPVTGNNGKEPKKYALVIVNQNYPSNLELGSSLTNPVNDAESMKCALEILGWTVATVRDGNLNGPQTNEKPNEIAFAGMQDGLEWLKKQLSGNHDSCGFFFFSGHAVGLPGQDKISNARREDPHIRWYFG